MIIKFAPNGDNPSNFEIADYRTSLKERCDSEITISSMIALNCIKAEMKLGNIPLEASELHFTDDNGNEIVCYFIKTGECIQWAEKDWQRSCADLHKHMPMNKPMEADMDLLMELI